MSGKAAKIQIAEQQQFILEDIRRSVKSPKRLIQRATGDPTGTWRCDPFDNRSADWITKEASRPLEASLASILCSLRRDRM